MVLHGDSLLIVHDPAQGRITVFDTTGKFRRQITLGRFSFWDAKAVTVVRSGRLAVRVSLSGGHAEGPNVQSQYLLMSLSGKIQDSLSVPSPAIERRAGFLILTADGPRYAFPIETVFALRPDESIVSGRTSSYRFVVQPRKGPPVTVERSAPLLSIAGAERKEWETWARYFAKRDQGAVEHPIAASKPIFRDILSDEAGRVWVHRYSVAEKRDIPPRPSGDNRPLLTWRDRNTYDIFSADGRELGTIELPPQALLLGIRGNKVFILREAEGGEDLVERYLVRGLGS